MMSAVFATSCIKSDRTLTNLDWGEAMNGNEQTVSPPTQDPPTETSAICHPGSRDADSQKPLVSLRKLEANRRNSTNSTGPKTAAGKKKVSRNAVRHGFYSKYLLIQHPDGNEGATNTMTSMPQFSNTISRWAGREERCVETIAVWSWRLRRVIRHESGQIARVLAAHTHDLQQSRAADAEELDAAPLTSPEMDMITDHLFLTSEGLEEQMRYEALINRQLNHALAEIERLQERRKGGPAAA